jgi:hypothetical protein
MMLQEARHGRSDDIASGKMSVRRDTALSFQNSSRLAILQEQ